MFLIGDEDGRLVAYLLALVGAGVGCAIAFVIANSVSGVVEQRGFAVMPVPGQPPMMGPPGYGPPPGYGQPPGYSPPPPGGPPSYR